MIFSCEFVVNNLKEKKLPAQVNRNRFDLILASCYWNCSTMENLSCTRVTRRRRGGRGVSALFQNLKKSALNVGKNALTRFIYGFNFSFKMLF